MDAEANQQRDAGAQDFQRLLTRLASDPERASAEYARIRARLVILARVREQYLIADEFADKALDQVAKKLALEEIREIEPYAIGVLRMLLLAHNRKKRLQPMEDPEMAVGEANPEHSLVIRLDHERQRRCFLACLEQFTPRERWFIFQYYPNEIGDLQSRRKRLAALMKIEPGTLATKISRLRDKLEKCCLNCYSHSPLSQPQQKG